MSDGERTAYPDPEGYPWEEPAQSGLLTERGWQPLETAELLTKRQPVIAIGSNASPSVLRHKLAAHLHRWIPMTRGSVSGLAVGHSAHVSRRGYVAAAPYRVDDPHPTAVMLLWLDTAQLRALDATEPNYRRRPLPRDLSCWWHDHWDAPHLVTNPHVYISTHGVVADEDEPLPLTDQTSVLRWLADRIPSLRENLSSLDAQRWLLSPTVQARIVRGLRERRLVKSARLGGPR